MLVVADIAALVATALGVVGALPQLRRLWSTRDISGVSLPGAMIGVATELGWLAYCWHSALWSAVPASLALATLNALISHALVRSGAMWARSLAAAVAGGGVLIAVAAIGGTGLLGVILPVAYGAKVAPAVWAACRAWVPSGVAGATWAGVLVESALWGAYGLIHRDLAIAMYSAIGVGAGMAILARLAVAADRIHFARGVTGEGRVSPLSQAYAHRSRSEG